MKVKTFVKSFIKKKPLRKASAKAQSAMEYLMTYGWAILIISVVLAALFQLGVFNPMTFAPKAPPGSCQVFRPNGPGTTSFINLEGICSGELPQYVAGFSGTPLTINVTSSVWPLSPQLSVSAWIYTTSPGTNTTTGGRQEIVDRQSFSSPCATCGGYEFTLNGNAYKTRNPGGNLSLELGISFTSGWNETASANQIPIDQWTFVAVTWNGANTIYYINGVSGTPISQTGTLATNTFNTGFIGTWTTRGNFFDGMMANIQIYNITLSANEIQALYLEGIGGAPIDLQHLVAWWPLNGNANDYSGNGNNGVPTNVIFVSNWYNSYTPP